MASVGNLAFEALADPTRRAILSFLATRGECSVGVLVAEVGTGSRTGVSNHLRTLRSAGLVSQRRQGRFRLYSLAPVPAEEILEFLQGYATALDAGNGEGMRRPKDHPGSSGPSGSGTGSNWQPKNANE
jgi:ArsR family transcriptional regulator